MKAGARNDIVATVKSVKSGDLMSMVKLSVTDPCEMASVLTTESVEQMGLKPGDKVRVLVKAVSVLIVKE